MRRSWRRCGGLCSEQGIAKSAFEFQMLYGVRRDLQRRLVAEGYWSAGVHAVWDGVVSVLHAAAGGAAGECDLPGEELVPELGSVDSCEDVMRVTRRYGEVAWRTGSRR